MSNSHPIQNESASETEPYPHRTARVLVKIAGAVFLLLLAVGSLSGNMSVLTNGVLIGLAVTLAVIALVGATAAESIYDHALAYLSR